MSGAHWSAASKAAQSIKMKMVWCDRKYREKQAARLRRQGAKARTAALEVRRSKPHLPARGTPDGKYYEKLRRTLGVQAAREALGIRL